MVPHYRRAAELDPAIKVALAFRTVRRKQVLGTMNRVEKIVEYAMDRFSHLQSANKHILTDFAAALTCFGSRNILGINQHAAEIREEDLPSLPKKPYETLVLNYRGFESNKSPQDEYKDISKRMIDGLRTTHRNNVMRT